MRMFHSLSTPITFLVSSNLQLVHHHKNLLPSVIQNLKLIYYALVFRANTFWLHLLYFVSISLVSFMALKATHQLSSSYTDLDIFFTSVSACTTSSMSVMEMEAFSNYQLVVITISMFLGGEVFTSLLELQLNMFKSSYSDKELKTGSVEDISETEDESLRHSSMKKLSFAVIVYLLATQLVGSLLIALYISQSHKTKRLLRRKNLPVVMFSVFTAVSTFTNCGFIPTNENMVVFRKNSGLLLLLIPLILMGNSLYAPTLRLMIWVLEKTTKKMEFAYILKHHSKISFPHLLPGDHSRFLTYTAAAFLSLQFLLFCSLEWNSVALNGMSQMEKMIGSFFQVVNSRHAGESIVDISVVCPAVLVFFILMMYLPPYTWLTPIWEIKQSRDETRRLRTMGSFFFSQLTYLTIFVGIICITESAKLKHDPLNFSVFFIMLEVISAYGNVGFSAGYSCERQLSTDLLCRNMLYGFVGRWSPAGKALLIVVMFFGRLKKKFGMHNEICWNLF